MSAQHDPIDMNGTDYIMYVLFPKTKQGVLRLRFPEERICRYRLHWNNRSALKMTQEYTKHVQRLEQIALLLPQLKDTREENAHLLTPELLDTWELFVRPLAPPGVDSEEILRLKHAVEPLTDDQQAILAQYQQAMEDEALQRLPMGGLHPYHFIYRSYRYVRLFSLKPPEIIVRSEGRMLASAMILYFCAEAQK